MPTISKGKRKRSKIKTLPIKVRYEREIKSIVNEVQEERWQELVTKLKEKKK